MVSEAFAPSNALHVLTGPLLLCTATGNPAGARRLPAWPPTTSGPLAPPATPPAPCAACCSCSCPRCSAARCLRLCSSSRTTGWRSTTRASSTTFTPPRSCLAGTSPRASSAGRTGSRAALTCRSSTTSSRPCRATISTRQGPIRTVLHRGSPAPRAEVLCPCPPAGQAPRGSPLQEARAGV